MDYTCPVYYCLRRPTTRYYLSQAAFEEIFANIAEYGVINVLV